MELTFFYNGELVKTSELHISAFEQAFLFGEGVYEPLIVRNREMHLAEPHFKRFLKGTEKLGMNLKVNGKVLEKTIMTLLDLNSMDDAMVRLIATKGESSGYFYEDIFSIPSLLIMTLPLKLFSDKLYFMGVTLHTTEWRDLSSSSFHTDIRTLSSLSRRMIYREARKEGHFDALLVNIEGYVTQCTGSNIFIVKENTLITPDVSCGAFPDAVREYILKAVAKDMNIETYEGFILIKNVYDADECFISSTEAGVLPVVACDGKKIGNGRLGRLTRQVQQYFSKWYKNS